MSKNEKPKMIGAIPVPPEAAAGLLDAIGLGHLVPDQGEQDAAARYVPASAEQARVLIDAAHQPRFQLGDVVRLRPHAHGRYKWPTNDDECIVTQVLDEPLRLGTEGTPGIARRLDFAIAIFDSKDGDLLEYLHDSREFEKVGSINN
jgi:hypothetical protein